MTRPDKNAAKRDHILAAAKALFAEAGLEGASLRAIAARAGYTPAALYFHFPSREAIYAEVLRDSLHRLQAAVAAGAAQDGFGGAALALFDFYAAALVAALAPMRALGGQEAATEAFALAVGLLVMSETRRIRLFGLSARALMESHLARLPQSPG